MLEPIIVHREVLHEVEAVALTEQFRGTSDKCWSNRRAPTSFLVTWKPIENISPVCSDDVRNVQATVEEEEDDDVDIRERRRQES